MTLKAFSILVVGSHLVGALVSPDGTGRLPAMGWNSWNEYACDINDQVFVTVADLMVDLGLKDAGYEYVNIDDCWSDKVNKRDNDTGRILVDKVKFPQGISHVADEVHARGLKLGIYGDAGQSQKLIDMTSKLLLMLSRHCDMRWLSRLSWVRRH